ncbi:hypothetical protein, partial [Enterobacter cloacae]|uniref:hypothetical protein n=1 Tax=Enterobacter cloacae TaxID=550 RepID=UPI001954257A
ASSDIRAPITLPVAACPARPLPEERGPVGGAWYDSVLPAVTPSALSADSRRRPGLERSAAPQQAPLPEQPLAYRHVPRVQRLTAFGT